QEVLLALDEGTPEAPATTDLLGQALDSTSELARLDPSQNVLKEQAQTLFENSTDLSLQIRSYLVGIEFNSKRLNLVEERLSLIDNLKRKYGDSIQAVLKFGENAKNQLNQITNAEEKIRLLEAEQIELLLTIGSVGQEISRIRHAAAQKLEKTLETELADLHMKGARLKVEFTQKADPNGVELEDGMRVAFYVNGLEQVEFLIETNPGEGYKPLVKIASGGETSRLMLALKYVLAQADYIPTLIFDEIDQGIGGRVGGIVGQKLSELSRQHQVLCVTHLPQLAAYGRQHFHVEKDLQADRTITKVNQVQGQERVLELAHMLGSVSEGTLKSAQELIQSVEN
ncbi:DNA repair protein RecN, partial [Chloroflexota bacterium]